MSKKKLKYINGELPENIDEILSNADEQDLRILALLLMKADENGEVGEDFSIESILKLSKSEVDASVKFWRGAGVLGSVRASRKRSAEQIEGDSGSAVAKAIITAHRNGAVVEDAEPYGSAELATLMEKRVVTSCFVDEAQKVFGKSFNNYDTGIIVGLVDRYDFEEEAVLALLSYVRKKGKKGVKYAERVAISFYDEGVTTAVGVVERINAIEQLSENLGKLKKMYGFGSRDLTKSEQALFEKWFNIFGYNEEIIRIAFDMTVNAIQKPVPKYTDKILENWYSHELRSKEDIERYEAEKKGAKSESDPAKSYDVGDFFDAALKRSFKDLK